MSTVRCDSTRALDDVLATARAGGGRIAFVPTMGALHDGHLALVRHAAELASTVVVSIFVNPTQFDAASDLATYPRTLDADLDALGALGMTLGATLVAYVPTVDDVYPGGAVSDLHVPEVTEHLCGASRPGHFDGVATVVVALLRRVRPDLAVLGRKDFQQAVVVRRAVEMVGLPVEIVTAPTVRDGDGIARSSRNALLSTAGRAAASRIPRALAVGVALARKDPSVGIDALLVAVGGALAGPDLEIDYLEAVDAERIVPVRGPLHAPTRARTLLAVAVHVEGGAGRVRLIDNVLLGDERDEQRLLDAVADPSR
jgi:pantoate--beta-alanine ligase